MRALIVLGLLALLPTAAAEIAAPDTATTVDPTLQLSPDGCDDCHDVSLLVHQGVPGGCMDCPGVLLYVEASDDGSGDRVRLYACQTGFVTTCVVEFDRRLVLS